MYVTVWGVGVFLVLYMSRPADLPRQSQSGESLEQLTLSIDRRERHGLIGHCSKERGLLQDHTAGQ